ncbi:14882_t:CDS:1, partial [Dentiscutata heterogama]
DNRLAYETFINGYSRSYVASTKQLQTSKDNIESRFKTFGMAQLWHLIL